MACIKPKLQSIKRCSNPDNQNGFDDTLSIALHDALVTIPVAPKYVETMTGSEYITAVCADPAKPFGTEAVWTKWTGKDDQIKAITKAKSNFKDSNAVTSTITVELDVDKGSLGQMKLMKGQKVHVIINKAGDGSMKWYGRANKPAIITNYEVEEGADKDHIKLEIEFNVYEPLFLPDTAVINYAA